MARTYAFDAVGRLPDKSDNVAIATRTLPAGTQVDLDGRVFALRDTILEGHRFAMHPIAAGEPLRSWRWPFGFASRPIAPGEYVCNAKILQELSSRNLDFALPPEANFYEKIAPYVLNEADFRPGTQVAPHTDTRTFWGYSRGAQRGVGTRNYVIILGTTSRTASYARALEQRLSGLAAAYEHIDGIVAVAHTEGGGDHTPHNLELVLRTLSGFMVHPNVGAVLAVDYGTEAMTNTMLQQYLGAHDYPLADVRHRFLTLHGHFQADLDQGAGIIHTWLPEVNLSQRREHPVQQVNVALQCGGSDAFSGISGNPLAAWVAKEIIRYGGTAHLAETDELIGAEAYVLQNVRDLETAHAFLATMARFKQRVAWHGHTAEGNPSGGNMYRGLYNIVLKSLGAAMKRHHAVRLDGVIDYGERIQAPGFYFMDSPGNDLESIAGQVAAGANMIFFITGNGAITNFPFVPTIKVVTTTRRYELLAHDMDVNAGAYLDGTPLPVLGERMLDLTFAVASGTRSAGEKAGHAQVSLWRDWPQTDDRALTRLHQRDLPSGIPVPIKSSGRQSNLTFQALQTAHGPVTDQLGLILPTSLCSGQIARLIATRLNDKTQASDDPRYRYVALPHTEGCGVSGGSSEMLYARTMLGYLTHPLVQYGVLLEHGCEKTHNDYMAHRLEQMGVDRHRFGWASVQLDGGIERVAHKVETWFATARASAAALVRQPVGLDALRVGMLAVGAMPAEVASCLAAFTQSVVGAGGTLVLPQTAAPLTVTAFTEPLFGTHPVTATLAYGQVASAPGLHIMETPTQHWSETLTGLGATGVEIILAYVTDHPRQAHPMVPVLQVTSEHVVPLGQAEDLDLCLQGDASRWPQALLRLLLDVAQGDYRPKLYAQGNTDFQITRGLLGVSL